MNKKDRKCYGIVLVKVIFTTTSSESGRFSEDVKLKSLLRSRLSVPRTGFEPVIPP